MRLVQFWTFTVRRNNHTILMLDGRYLRGISTVSIRLSLIMDMVRMILVMNFEKLTFAQ